MSETGELWLAYVDKSVAPASTASGADWQLIGGQKGLDFGRSLATADATTKDSVGNEESLATIRSSEISLDNLYEADDTGLEVLEAMFENRVKRLIKVTNGSVTWTFFAWCTDFPLSAPMDDVVSQSITLKVTGAKTRTPALS